jgi:hypothetical protein
MSNPAPDALELVRAFVNTWDGEGPVESLTSPEALRDWLAGRGLLDADAAVGEVDYEHALDAREALRAVLVSHHGEPLDPAVPPRLDAAARRARLGVRFDEAGAAHVAPEAQGADGAIGRLLAIVHDAIREGTWARLKVCPADDCQWAFYDRSRNRSAVWCSMEVCGNRAKVRGYRKRQTRGAGA